MPGKRIHLKFDQMLKDEGIIHHNTETAQIHEYMDFNVKKFGGMTHRLEDPRHQPEIIRKKIKNGKTFKISDSVISSGKNYLEAKFRNQIEKTDLLRVAYGHRIVDEIDEQRSWKNMDVFYKRCMMEYKFRNWNQKKII